MSWRRLGVGTRRTLVVVGVLAAIVTMTAGPVSAVAGTSTYLVGNGKCEGPVPGDTGKEPFASADLISGSYNFFVSSTVGGQVYIAERTYVRGEGGLVAGAARGTTGLTGAAAEGAEADQVALSGLQAFAVDPSGRKLYVGEKDDPGGRIREVDLQKGTIRSLSLPTNVGVPVDMAADGVGNVYVADTTGVVTKLSVTTSGSVSATPLRAVPGIKSLAVDLLGKQLFAAVWESHTVVKLSTSSQSAVPEVVAGTAGSADATGDDGPAKAALLRKPIAVAVDAEGENLYILDQVEVENVTKVRHIDLTATPPVIATVVGPGGTGPAGKLPFTGYDMAVGAGNNLIIADQNACSVFQVEDPRRAPPTTLTTQGTLVQTTLSSDTTVPPTTPTTAPAPVEVTVPATVPSADPVVTQNANPQTGGEAGADNVRSFDPNIGRIVNPGFNGSGSFTGNSGFSANPVPSPGPSPGPSPLPTIVVQPPPAPAPTLVPEPLPPPVANPSVLPPAPQPVNNPALVSAQREAARGAARYAMVRAEEDGATTVAAALVGGAVVTVFLCLMLAAPKAAPKRKPRPRGAY